LLSQLLRVLVCSIAGEFEMAPEPLRIWVRRADVDDGKRAGVTSEKKERIRPSGP